jgi:hypothetical protein
MNIAYKHLDSKLKIADLTIGQWMAALAGLVLASVWGFSVSPFGSYLTLASAIYLGAIPVGAALLASYAEFDLWLLVRAAISWRRLEGQFLPGPGGSASGYVIGEQDEDPKRAPRGEAFQLDMGALWDS